jgi:hypothetical protein
MGIGALRRHYQDENSSQYEEKPVTEAEQIVVLPVAPPAADSSQEPDDELPEK